jgi:hypothetical protein
MAERLTQGVRRTDPLLALWGEYWLVTRAKVFRRFSGQAQGDARAVAARLRVNPSAV